MYLTYDEYTMPCVGMTFKGAPLFKQPNGRLTTQRMINNKGQDLSPFVTIDVRSISVKPLPDDFEGYDFESDDIYAIVNAEDDLQPLYLYDFDTCLIRTHRPPLTEDTCYGMGEPSLATIEDILFEYNEETERVFLEGGKLCIFSSKEWLDPQSIVDQYNAIQEEVVSDYLHYAEIDEDGYLIPIFYERCN